MEYNDDEIDQFLLDAIHQSTFIPRPKVWKEIEQELDSEERIYFDKLKSRILESSFVVYLFLFIEFGLIYFLPYKSVQLRANKSGVPATNYLSYKNSEAGIANRLRLSVTKIPISIYQDKISDLAYQYGNLLQSGFKINTDNEEPYKSGYIIKQADSSSFARSSLRTFKLTYDTSSRDKTALVEKENKGSMKSLITVNRESNKFSISLYASKEFSGYTLTDNDQKGANGKEIEKRERTIFSASFGINLNYRLNKKWSVQSGIAFSWSNSNIDSATAYAVQESAGNIQYKFNSVLGYSYLHSPATNTPTPGDSLFTAKSSTHFHYLSIPLAVSYRISAGRVSIVPTAGITFNFLTNAYLETDVYGRGYDENESQIPIKGLKKINIGMLVKADLEYRISNKWSILLIPSFNSTLSPVNLKTALSTYPYNFGIGAGIQFEF